MDVEGHRDTQCKRSDMELVPDAAVHTTLR